MVDYWSNYFAISEQHKKTLLSVIAQFKVHFARHGIPSVVMTDNGPEFASRKFEEFAKTWKFEHITSSPRFPLSNGKAENAVKTCKALLMKARTDRQDPLLALLAWRNTQSEGFNTSPVQRLMGRLTRTLLPTTHSLLEPKIDKQTVASASTHPRDYPNATARRKNSEQPVLRSRSERVTVSS